MCYKIRYVIEENGRSQVLDFVKEQGEKFEAKYYAYINQLIEKGPTLPRPLADYLRDGIHELRLKHKRQVRVLYFFFHQEYIVISHAFIKRGSAVPEKEIIKALRNKEILLALVEEKRLKWR